MNEAECFQQCCMLGVDRCQYLWIFRNKCYAVGCSLQSNYCDPQLVHPNVPPATSTYFEVYYSYGGQVHQTSVSPTLDSLTPGSNLYNTVVTPTHDQFSPPLTSLAVISPSSVKTFASQVTLSAQHSSSHQVMMSAYQFSLQK